MLTIYQLTLGSYLQANAFETFARKRYLPALYSIISKLDQRHSIRLLRRSREHESDPLDLSRQFLLLVECKGVTIDLLRIDDPTVQGLFEAFAPEIVQFGSFEVLEDLNNDEKRMK